jgi:hypothetical protein
MLRPKSLAGSTPSKGFSVLFELHRRHVIERPVWSKTVVLVLKCFGYVVNFMHARKQVGIEDLGAVGAVEPLDVAILYTVSAYPSE